MIKGTDPQRLQGNVSEGNGTFQSIQALRAIAALMVMLVHLFPVGFGIGAAGVDLFFVISGFIIATIGVRESQSTFVLKRIGRVVPLYWAVTLFMCVLALKPGFFSHFSFDIPRLLMSLFFIPYRDVDGVVWPLVQVGWTLNFEVFFYAVFALCLMSRKPLAIVTSTLVLLAIVGLVWRPQNALLSTWTSSLLIEFVFGIAIAVMPRARNASAGIAVLLAGIAWYAVAAYIGGIPDNNGLRFVVWGIGGALIVLGALTIEEAGRWPKAAYPLSELGNASYSLYLLHGLVIALLHKLMGETILSAVAIIAVSIVVSLISYHVFERPAAKAVRMASGIRPRAKPAN